MISRLPALLAAALAIALATGAAQAASGLTAQQCRYGQQQMAKSQPGIASLLKALQASEKGDLAAQTTGSLHDAAAAHQESRSKLIPVLDDYLKTIQRLQAAFRACR